MKDKKIMKFNILNKKGIFYIKKKKNIQIYYNFLIDEIVQKVNEFKIIESDFKMVLNVINYENAKIELIIKLHLNNHLMIIIIKKCIKK